MASLRVSVGCRGLEVPPKNSFYRGQWLMRDHAVAPTIPDITCPTRSVRRVQVHVNEERPAGITSEAKVKLDFNNPGGFASAKAEPSL